MDLAKAAKDAPDVLKSLKDGEGAAEVYDAFIQRNRSDAVGGRAERPAFASRHRESRRARLRISGRPAPALTDALTKAGGLKFGAKALTAAQMKAMIADVQKSGDAARGEAIFPP